MTDDALTRLFNAKSETRLFGFIGQAGAGKDWLANQLNVERVLKFADPMYRIAHVMFPAMGFRSQRKLHPGAREILQKIGAWGKGIVSEKYPLTIERALFIGSLPIIMRRTEIDSWINWDLFGTCPTFWIDIMKSRIGCEGMTVITDCRFRFETDFVTAHDGHNVLVACRPNILAKRRESLGYAAKIEDITEDLATHLTTHFLAGRLPDDPWFTPGSGYSVVWNDDPASLDPELRKKMLTQTLRDAGSTPSDAECGVFI